MGAPGRLSSRWQQTTKLSWQLQAVYLTLVGVSGDLELLIEMQVLARHRMRQLLEAYTCWLNLPPALGLGLGRLDGPEQGLCEARQRWIQTHLALRKESEVEQVGGLGAHRGQTFVDEQLRHSLCTSTSASDALDWRSTLLPNRWSLEIAPSSSRHAWA